MVQSPSGTQREDGCCTPEPTGRGDILRGSLHARSFRLVPKAANAPQGRAAQLLCGAVAGPLFASAFSAIGAARAGYDWERLPVSSLAIGRHGWLQRMSFVGAGVLYSCAGGGLRRSANRRVGPRAVPALVAGVGVGLIGSGLFVTDPVGGFPPDHPAGRARTTHARALRRPGPGGCTTFSPSLSSPASPSRPWPARPPPYGAGTRLGWLLGRVRPRHGRQFRYVRPRLW